MSNYCFYDDPIDLRREAFNDKGRRVGFMVKDLVDDIVVRGKVCSDRGFPCADWKDGQVIGDVSFLPSALLRAIFFAQSQKIQKLEKGSLSTVWHKSEKNMPEGVPLFAWVAYCPEQKRSEWRPAVVIKRSGGRVFYFEEERFSPSYVMEWTVATVPEGR